MIIHISKLIYDKFCRKIPHIFINRYTDKYLKHLLLDYKCNSTKAITGVNLLPNCNVGTIGHVDHGKTTLTAAITKYLARKGRSKYFSYDDIDCAPEEKLRGITINIYHVGYNTEKRRYSHIDCPGHADYVKNMISGTSQMDGAIVVIAATDGTMPQTREHLLLARLIGVKKVIVFVNKADLVDKEVLELCELEIRDVLPEYEFDGNDTPVVYGSALLALNDDTSEYGEPAIQKLLDTLDKYFEIPERDLTSPFYMPIDNVLSKVGRGTVVVGTLKRGTARKQDPATLVGYNEEFKTVITDIQMFHKSYDKAEAGDNCGVLLRGIKHKEIRRGLVLCPPKSLELYNSFDCLVYVLSEKEGGKNKPISDKYLAIAHGDTWHSAARIDFSSELSMIMPGEHATVRTTFMFKMPILKGQKFTLRDREGGTIATAVISNIRQTIKYIQPSKFRIMALP